MRRALDMQAKQGGAKRCEEERKGGANGRAGGRDTHSSTAAMTFRSIVVSVAVVVWMYTSRSFERPAFCASRAKRFLK
jgi:hypothetical protein